MAPAVEHIDDETVLEKMLEEATIFEDRKKIRARLRELRKQKKDPSGTMTAAPERKRTRDPGLTVSTVPSSTPAVDSNNALSPVSPASKTQRVVSPGGTTETQTTVVEEEDKGSKTQTTTTVTTGPGSKRVEVTTLSKSGAGDNKSANIKQEVTSEKVEKTPTGISVSVSKSVSSSSSSSSSTPAPAPATTRGRPQTKFQKELEEKKKAREDKQKEDQEKWKETQSQKKTTVAMTRKQQAVEQKNKKANLFDKFGGKASTMGPPGGGGGGGTRMVVQNATTIKQKLLDWSKHCTRNYQNVSVTNFSSSWCDGMAFCALVHYYFPESFDFGELDPKNRRYNFDLAFDTAEKMADCMPLLETDDMIMMKNKPDWKCVFTYVQSLYRGLHRATGQMPPQ